MKMLLCQDIQISSLILQPFIINEEPESVIFSLEGATDKGGPESEYPRALSQGFS